MKTLKQLLRQPLKTLLGLLLLTLAAAVLCVTVGQFWAAKSTKAELDRKFSTVAIPSQREDAAGMAKYHVSQEVMDFLSRMAREHPDIVKSAIQHGVLSASIPELTPFSGVAQRKVPLSAQGSKMDSFSLFYSASSGATPHFDAAMLEFTLEEITVTKETESHMHSGIGLSESAFFTKEDYEAYVNANEWTQIEKGYSAKLKGTVTQVLSLEASWDDPAGRTLWLHITAPSLEELEALELAVGQRYIAYSVDYYDDYDYLVSYMKAGSYKHIDFEPYTPELFEVPTQQEKENFKNNKDIDVVMLYNEVPLVQWQYDSMNACSMAIQLGGGLTEYEVIRDENGLLQEVKAKTQITYTDAKGDSITVDKAQLYEAYAIPTIQKLSGSAEDFLASADGKSWRDAIERDKINNHGFCVYGVEEMDHLAAFSLGKATISEGREFTAEEIENGQRVCIIHCRVAAESGLKVGDTVTLSFYGSDYANPYQKLTRQGVDQLRPAATMYYDTTPILETAQYTIVGIWSGQHIWPDPEKEPYLFSGNTVFVPRSSVQVRMERRNNILSNVGVLKNGMIHEFHELAKRGGFAGTFKYHDQNYSKIATNFHNYDALGQQMLTAGAVIYAMMLILFLLLFPAAMRKPVQTMQSLGVPYGKRFFHVLLSSMSIVVTATVLGGIAGSRIWQYIADLLQTLAESAVALELESQMLITISLAQMVLALALSLVVALAVARRRTLSSRR